MSLKSKICGITDSKTLEFLINHKYPPQFIGFIVNYEKSKRYVKFEQLKKLVDVERKKSFFVAVLVKPDKKILDSIEKLNFDYYQIYDCSPEEIKSIKNKYQKKIITAITVDEEIDVIKYKDFIHDTNIFLFDSKGYEQSLSFDHNLIKNLDIKKDVMLAGNINFDDALEKFIKIADIIDISGGLETSGLKDVSKIDIFLKNLNKLNNEN